MLWFWSSNNPRYDAHKERLAASENETKECIASMPTFIFSLFSGHFNPLKSRNACRPEGARQTIVGGTGGKGGKSRKEGGHGGAGEASKLTFEQAASYNRTQGSKPKRYSTRQAIRMKQIPKSSHQARVWSMRARHLVQGVLDLAILDFDAPLRET
ncbi:hypothetical protein K438DRAFT_1758765 [Mycena galopus ATCC 62051]|nr:hypothetical protein K438DRAFT_1758765 [Mycena galopus ATCC 62051]